MTNMQETKIQEKKFDIVDHIGIFDDAIPEELIDEFLNFHQFAEQNNINMFAEMKRYNGGSFVSDDSRVFGPGQFDFNHDENPVYLKSSPRFEKVNSLLSEMVYAYSQNYFPLLSRIKTETFFIEGLQTQKTEPGQGYHVWHDDGGDDRLMTFIIYLNDVEEGGETEFLNQHQRIVPKRGRVVLFPASYTHTHRGNPPINGEKYILTGWVYSKVKNGYDRMTGVYASE
jgi:hypothetical protein